MVHFTLLNFIKNFFQGLDVCSPDDTVSGCVFDNCTCDGCVGNKLDSNDGCMQVDNCRYKDQSECPINNIDQCSCIDKYTKPNEGDCTKCSTCDLSGGSDACDQQWGGNMDWVSCLSDDWICTGVYRIGNYGNDVCPNPF